MPKTPPTTPHSGRPPRLNAWRKSVLIDLTTIAFMKKLGGGKLGPGIDRAAVIIDEILASGLLASNKTLRKIFAEKGVK